MRKKQRNFLALIGVLMVLVCCVAALKVFYFDKMDANGPLLPSQEETNQSEQPEESEVVEPAQKVYVNVFFIGQNANKEEVYRAVRREYDEAVDGSKVKFAIKSLVAGPLSSEKGRGIYSEIPVGTEVISVDELSDRIIINLTSNFENGGGTDSLYKRVYQLIKTAQNNTNKPVYLYLNGKKAEVLGGEGLMLNQPLNDNSLDG